MSPRLFTCGALIVSVTVAWATAGAPAPPAAPAKADDSPAAALYRRADFKGIDDPKTTLQDVLDQIAVLYNVQFAVNTAAFRFEMVDDVSKKEIAISPLPPMKNVRLTALLERILLRINVPSGASFLIHNDTIELTTCKFRAAEIWGGHNAPLLPLVHRKFDKVPLDEVLKELAEVTEFNIVIDFRVAEKAKTPVTARFLNTPLDTAVRFTADMADLRSIQQDNVLYVTTKENAAVWSTRMRKEQKLDNPIENGDPQPRLGSGPGSVRVIEQKTN